MAISQELIAALDDLIQVGAQASAALRSAYEVRVQTDPTVLPQLNAVAVAQGVLSSIKIAARTEQSIPVLVQNARDAVAKLASLAGAAGDAALASSLGLKVQAMSAQMKADGLGTPWMWILGIGAVGIIGYFAWQRYSKKRTIASFEYPDSAAEDLRPKLQGLGRALGRLGGASCRQRQLGRGPKRRKSLGAGPSKYEFEPETRLEGIQRGSSRRSRK